MPAPGDIGFAHSNGFFGKCIRFGERIRWGEHPSHWNHAFIVDRVVMEGSVTDGTAQFKTYIIQAEPSGVTDDKLIESVGSYTLVEPHLTHDRADILAFARAQVGSHYGWGSILSVALDIMTPNWFPSFRRPGTWICSALVGESLRFGGWLKSWKDIYTVTPAQVFEAYTNDR
jgi:hypothetical protein